MTSPLSILIIDDELEITEFISVAAEQMGSRCVVAKDAAGFVAALTPEIGLVMIDLVMPGIDGIELLRLLAKQGCKTNVVLMSGLGKQVLKTAEHLAQTLGLSVIGHLYKPFHLSELESLLESSTARAAEQRPSAPARALTISDDDLRAAVQNDEFVVYYQPQIDIATHEVIGVEALVRWKHPAHGLIFPDAFISRLEQLGLIDDMGWIVFRRGFSELALFANSRGVLPRLSVNVPVQSLHDLEFPEKFVSLAAQYGIRPQDTILEVTEGGLLIDLSTTLDVLTRLRLKQVCISVDDFGTGYAMLQQLQSIPATEIKIDRSFVQKLPESRSERVMVVKSIEIGHDLGMKVVAEGVETCEQLDFLRAHQCDIAQGYLFSRPLPPMELVQWLGKHAASLQTEDKKPEICAG